MTKDQAIDIVRCTKVTPNLHPDDFGEWYEAIAIVTQAAKESKSGKWHYNRCSECKQLYTYFLRGTYMIDIEKRPNYCPHCGAKMEVDDAE